MSALDFAWWVAYFRATDTAGDDEAPAAAGPPIRALPRLVRHESPEEALTRRIMARRMSPEAMLKVASSYARAMEAAGR